jgi:hypothetical protein
VINPFLIAFESGEQEQIIQIKWIYENTWGFYIRSIFSSIAILILAFYATAYSSFLFYKMGKHEAFKGGVRIKVALIALLIVFVLFLHFTMIWTSNWFWHQESQDYWIGYLIVYYGAGEITPFLIFCFVLAIQIS